MYYVYEIAVYMVMKNARSDLHADIFYLFIFRILFIYNVKSGKSESPSGLELAYLIYINKWK